MPPPGTVDLPGTVRTEAELEELLSRPSPAVVDVLARLEGDVVVLGVGGKMGPTLAKMARRAFDQAGSSHAVIGVARFTRPTLQVQLQEERVRTISCDLLDRESVRRLPDAAAVIYMAGMKFGTTGAEALTWAMNTLLPAWCAERYRGVPVVVFSSGNLYPFVPVAGGGATEETPPAPLGEYAQSVLARERIYEHFSRRDKTPAVIYRLNYAAELRYGVLLDVAMKVRDGEPIDLSMGHFNAIWQGDANAIGLACLSMAASPPAILNVTGPETLSIREVAGEFGKRLGKAPVFRGSEAGTALLSNASKSTARFGPPTVSIARLIDWTADWVKRGGAMLGKPTHFETRDGKY